MKKRFISAVFASCLLIGISTGLRGYVVDLFESQAEFMKDRIKEANELLKKEDPKINQLRDLDSNLQDAKELSEIFITDYGDKNFKFEGESVVVKELFPGLKKEIEELLQRVRGLRKELGDQQEDPVSSLTEDLQKWPGEEGLIDFDESIE